MYNKKRKKEREKKEIEREKKEMEVAIDGEDCESDRRERKRD